MYTKHEFKLKMFVAVCWSYSKWCILIVGTTVPLVEYTVLKAFILALPYKSTLNFVEVLGLKGWHARRK